MKLNHLSLFNFRNYDQLKLSFHSKLNIFLGQNAQGKTNLLESIYFLALTRSHRTAKDRELIKWEEVELSVQGVVEKKTATIPLQVDLTSKGRAAFVNHLKENRLADYIGQLNLVMFSPEDLELIKGSPSQRRRFLDMEIGQIRPLYLYDSLRYNRVLKERNAYIKFDSEKMDAHFLDVLDQQLVEYGSPIMKERRAFLHQLEKHANAVHAQLTQGTEELTFDYQASVKDDFLSDLTAQRKKDLFRRQTSVGPHRDELIFSINGINVADFGSQGQQRTVALSLKLAEIELMREETGEYPILLLDDVMSELDNQRQLDLLQTTIGKTQTFITTTTLDHLPEIPKELSVFDVNAGRLTKK